jgi:acyl-CoA synthetase (AMP-forming)/AMP-acid ligase II
METLPDSSLVDRARALARSRPSATAYTWLEDGEVEERALSFAELDRSGRAVAAELTARGLGGQRVLLMYAPGLPFITAFLGCLYAGVVAVPLSPPRTEHAARALEGIIAHADPSLLLCDRSVHEKLSERLRALGGPPALATDELGPELADLWRPAAIDPGSIAFLQYTSGSTGSPKGVEITHANLVANLDMIRTAFEHDERTVIVGWLPFFHDMGLIGNVLESLFVGGSCVLMAPAAFIQRPMRWLRAISKYRGTTSGSPNFGYQLCVQKARAEDIAGLDLSSWRLAYNGSEPVRAETLEAFSATFAPAGLRPEALYPCYGLAEASLFVTGGRRSEPYVIRDFDGAALAEGRARPAASGGADRRRLVGCGRAWLGERLLLVDPESCRPVPEGAVGEIWVAGPNVARGYRHWPADQVDPFRGRLESGEGTFLRTGDLGFLSEGELFVTGRLKDLLIQKGQNYYPQDIEWVAGNSHPAFRADHAAAFTVEAEPGSGEGERLVVVQEVEREHAERAADGDLASRALRDELSGAVREAVARHFDLRVWRVVLLEPGSLPRTTSGKVQRRQTRALWQADSLRALGCPSTESMPCPPRFP